MHFLFQRHPAMLALGSPPLQASRKAVLDIRIHVSTWWVFTKILPCARPSASLSTARESYANPGWEHLFPPSWPLACGVSLSSRDRSVNVASRKKDCIGLSQNPPQSWWHLVDSTQPTQHTLPEQRLRFWATQYKSPRVLIPWPPFVWTLWCPSSWLMPSFFR